LNKRKPRKVIYVNPTHGRQLFNNLRSLISSSEDGAGIL